MSLYNQLINKPCMHGKNGECEQCKENAKRRRYIEANAHKLRCVHCGNSLDNCMCTC